MCLLNPRLLLRDRLLARAFLREARTVAAGYEGLAARAGSPHNAHPVVVVTGAGGKAFISGADISRFGDERSTEQAVAHYNATVDQANASFYEFPKPTIAMIRGYCIGGGVGLAVCCDLRICSGNSRFA